MLAKFHQNPSYLHTLLIHLKKGNSLEKKKNFDFGGVHTFTYYAIVSIYRTSKNSPTSQYVNYGKRIIYCRSKPRRCTTAK